MVVTKANEYGEVQVTMTEEERATLAAALPILKELDESATILFDYLVEPTHKIASFMGRELYGALQVLEALT